MSDKDLDKLFKSKLEELQSEPSPRAWDEISSEIQSRKPVAWWYVAAAVVILMSAVLIFQFNGSTDAPEIAMADVTEETIAPVQAAPEEDLNGVKSDINSEEIDLPPVQDIEEDERIAQNQVADQPQAHAGEPVETTTEVEIEPALPTDEEVVVADLNEEEISEVNAFDTDILQASETVAAVTGSTRSFNIEQFGSAEIGEETPPGDEEERGLKKVWNLLKNVKEPSNGIGDLREMKNELLAFGKSRKETEDQ